MTEAIETHIRKTAAHLNDGQLCDWWTQTREQWNKCLRNGWNTDYIRSLFTLIDKIYKDRVGGAYYFS